MPMADYLAQKTADYTGEQLSINPQKVLSEIPVENQKMHEMDDGTVEVVELNSTTYFKVEVQWPVLDNTDAETIRDLYMNSSKANRKMNTFEWVHPVDGNTYIARFVSNVSKELQPGNIRKIPQATLQIEGYK